MLLATAALAEFAARRLYTRLAPESGRKAVASLLGNEPGQRSGYFLQHPYMFYTYRPGYAAFGYVQFNSHGHRGPERPVQKPAGVFRVLTIGGSTTASFPYVHDPADTWPSQLERILTEKTGAKVEVVNAGLNSGTSAEWLAHYNYRNRYFGADAVVLHVGLNDSMALHFPDYNPEYTHYTSGWRNASLTPRPLEQKLLRSAIVKVLYAHWLSAVSLDAAMGRESVTTMTPAQSLANVQVNEPVGFRRNLDLLIRTISADGAVPVLFTVVHAPEARMRKDKEFGRYTESMVLGYRKNRVVIGELARQHRLKLIDIPEGAIPVADFIDFCHVNEKGELIKADAVAQVLIPQVQAWQRGAPATPPKR